MSEKGIKIMPVSPVEEKLEVKKTARPIMTDADREKAQDVSSYVLPDELESRLMVYSDDESFQRHVRRAHKYFSTIAECKSKNKWKIEVKGYEETTDRYPVLHCTRYEQILTPEELREIGVKGKFRFVLTYYDPFKTNKKTHEYGGLFTTLSQTYEIPAPVVHGINPDVSRTPRQPSMTPSFDMAGMQALHDSFNTMTLQSHAMAQQAMKLQMDAIFNRQQIVSEGIEKGRLLQKNEELEKQIARVEKERAEAAQLAAIAMNQHEREEGESEESAPQSKFETVLNALSPLIEELSPVIKNYVVSKIPGAGSPTGTPTTETMGGNEGKPHIPPQQ